MTRPLLAFTLLLASAAVSAQDCARVPEAYRAQCEAGRSGGVPADVGALMQGSQNALAACAGKTGAALKSCVVQQGGGGDSIRCASLPADQQPRCEAMAAVAAEARSACQSRFDVADRSAFDACLREEIARRRPAAGR